MRRILFGTAVLYLLFAVGTRVADALGLGTPTPLWLSGIMLVQTSRPDRPSLGDARPLAPHRSHTRGEALPDQFES